MNLSNTDQEMLLNIVKKLAKGLKVGTAHQVMQNRFVLDFDLFSFFHQTELLKEQAAESILSIQTKVGDS